MLFENDKISQNDEQAFQNFTQNIFILQGSVMKQDCL